MNIYEKKFNQNILPKYGKKRNSDYDKLLINDNNSKLKINVESIRVKFNFPVFSIDPPKCTDADDAFSIYEIENNLYLAVHIADPTNYISLNSLLWNDILSRCITHYPSNNDPIHMLPEDIIIKSSLMTDREKEEKNAISIIFQLNKKTLLPINNIKIQFTTITISKNNKYTYKKASNVKNKIFDLGLKISANLKKLRSEKTIGTKLSDIDFLSIKYDDTIMIDNFSNTEKLMKEMIAEFAILTNSFVGEFIMKNIDGIGIFRTCNFKLVDNLSGEEILDKIIKDGVRGEYSENNSSHDLVGKKLYCHFTSPIRRATDCICHYILKCYFLNLDYPWDKSKLSIICNNIVNKIKVEKKIQFDDIKFRTIQIISSLLHQYNIKLKVTINSYSGLFLNCIIKKLILIDNENKSKEYNIHISYTLKRRGLNIYNQIGKYHTISISKVNLPDKFDEGIFEELDFYFENML